LEELLTEKEKKSEAFVEESFLLLSGFRDEKKKGNLDFKLGLEFYQQH
jgi:hypothetical protein